MPEKPSFPFIMFMAAFIKDFIFDPIIFMLTLILMPLGWILGVFVSILYGGIFWLWILFHPSARKSKMMTRGMIRVLAAIGISFIPVVRLLIPEMTLVVWLTHRHEIKLWKHMQAKATRKAESAIQGSSKKRRIASRRMRRMVPKTA